MESGFPLGCRQASAPSLPPRSGCQGNQIPLTVAYLEASLEGTELRVPHPLLTVMFTSPSPNPNAVSPPSSSFPGEDHQSPALSHFSPPFPRSMESVWDVA